MRYVVGALRVAEDEFRAKVRRSRRDGQFELVYACGAKVGSAERDLLLQHLCSERANILASFPRVGGESGWEAPFVASWAERGYDLTTLRFSIRHLCGAPKRSPRPRRYRLRPGVLFVRWSCVEYDRTGDIVVYWHRPCSKRDSNHFHSWLSMPLALEGKPILWDRNLLETLEKRGFDLTSLSFEVHHTGRRAELTALAQERQPTPEAQAA